MSKKSEDLIRKGLWILTILVCIKSIFTDFGADSAYQVAMSYRHLQGDAMLREMWEPHQTSIFLNDFLMGLYHLIVPSYTGVVMYLQLCGTLLYGLLGWLTYRTVKDVTSSFVGQAIWMFLLVFRAKQTPFPEFANLEIGFSILSFCLLLRFFKAQEKWQYPVLLGITTFLQALSYPSCVLCAIPVVFLFFLKTQKKWRNSLLFLGTAGVCGICYLAYFLVRLGSETFLLAIRNIFLSDTHSSFKFSGYWTGFGIMTGAALGSVLVAAVILWIIGMMRKSDTKQAGSRSTASGNNAGEGSGMEGKAVGEGSGVSGKGAGEAKLTLGTLSVGVFLVLELVMLALQRKTGIDWNCSIYVLPVILILLAGFGYRKATEEERRIWLTGVLLSAGSFFATLLLTDLGMITITAYLVLGGGVSLLLLQHVMKNDKYVITMLLLLVFLHRGLVVWGIANTNDRVHVIWEVQNIIRSGPAVGVVCDHVSKAQALWTIEDFEAYIQPEDKVLFIGEELIDPMVFLYAKAEISNYSTIDTPQYNECLEEYLRLNPEKEPTLVAISSWFGTPNVAEDTWIMQWVNARYELAEDARYWRFYRRKDDF
jgi:hypothetical protein